jgi:hypothetical protein
MNLPPDQVRRLTADVQILQAQVEGMDKAVTAFADDLTRLRRLMADLTGHVNELAATLVEQS